MDDGDSDEDDSGTLHQAAFLGEMKVLQKLLSVEGVDVNELDDKNGQTALYLAATAGRLNVARVRAHTARRFGAWAPLVACSFVSRWPAR